LALSLSPTLEEERGGEARVLGKKKEATWLFSFITSMGGKERERRGE